MGKTTSKKRKGGKPTPLAAPVMKSRKKARQVTTLFHKYTRQRDVALEKGDSDQVERLDRNIEAMGGRQEYQRASQVSTSFHSTSKWVLGVLSRNGWLHGIFEQGTESGISVRKRPRRETRCLEVGAINTEMLDASERTWTDEDTGVEKRKYKLQVRAIDINSMHTGRIEEADFLKIPVPNPEERFDCVVCSMVLNCVTTPEHRGDMVARLFHFLNPNGLAFVTIPKLCLTLSPFMDKQRFLLLLKAVGFEISETKESPKVSFFICRRPLIENAHELDPKWNRLTTIRRGKKFRNDFSIVLRKDQGTDRSL